MKPQSAALVVALAGTAGLAAGFVLEPRQAFFSYLVAFAFVLSLALGALFFLCIGHVMRATWVVVTRRLTELVAGLLPLCALGFVPIVFGLGRLYPWAGHGATDAETAASLVHTRPYLNTPFYLGRAAFYLTLWVVVAELVLAWSRRQERTGQDTSGRARVLSAAALPILGITTSFAAIDWLMSLTPAWYSTIYGMLFWAGGFVASLALLALLSFLARSRSDLLARSLRPDHSLALGRLIVAFLIFWVYMQYAQGFIIWIGNKPSEAPYYLTRAYGSWGSLFAAIVVGHFALPFLALMSRRFKLSVAAMAALGAWVVVMHYLDLYWLIMPVLHPGGVHPHWLDLAALMALGGFAVLFASFRLRGLALVPERDPALAAGLLYRGNP